jgi:hydroxyacylglutathione hydrolase
MASPRASAPLPALTSPVLTEREPTKEEVVGVPRTKPEDVLQQFEAKSVTLIDVRAADDYKERHIPGAMHIPLAYIDGEVPYLPRDKPIVAYCT